MIITFLFFSVKKGYYKKSLAYHPDRVSGTDKDVATKKFQVLSQVYNILSDDGRRAEYDETGKSKLLLTYLA